MLDLLLFQMGLKTFTNLLEGTFYIMDNTAVEQNFIATPSMKNSQDEDDQDARGVEQFSAYKKLDISSYSINIAPFNKRSNQGIRGNFYYITPDPVKIGDQHTRELGIYCDANLSGSGECVIPQDDQEWHKFQDFMDNYQKKWLSWVSG